VYESYSSAAAVVATKKCRINCNDKMSLPESLGGGG
jgi:hypothetical protein